MKKKDHFSLLLLQYVIDTASYSANKEYKLYFNGFNLWRTDVPHGSSQIRRLEWRGVTIWAGDTEFVGDVGSGARLGGRLQHACRLLQ